MSELLTNKAAVSTEDKKLEDKELLLKEIKENLYDGLKYAFDKTYSYNKSLAWQTSRFIEIEIVKFMSELEEKSLKINNTQEFLTFLNSEERELFVRVYHTLKYNVFTNVNIIESDLRNPRLVASWFEEGYNF